MQTITRHHAPASNAGHIAQLIAWEHCQPDDGVQNKVNAAGKQVGGDEHPGAAGTELLERAPPRRLALVCRDAVRRQAVQ